MLRILKFSCLSMLLFSSGCKKDSISHEPRDCVKDFPRDTVTVNYINPVTLWTCGNTDLDIFYGGRVIEQGDTTGSFLITIFTEEVFCNLKKGKDTVINAPEGFRLQVKLLEYYTETRWELGGFSDSAFEPFVYDSLARLTVKAL